MRKIIVDQIQNSTTGSAINIFESQASSNSLVSADSNGIFQDVSMPNDVNEVIPGAVNTAATSAIISLLDSDGNLKNGIEFTDSFNYSQSNTGINSSYRHGTRFRFLDSNNNTITLSNHNYKYQEWYNSWSSNATSSTQNTNYFNLDNYNIANSTVYNTVCIKAVLSIVLDSGTYYVNFMNEMMSFNGRSSNMSFNQAYQYADFNTAPVSISLENPAATAANQVETYTIRDTSVGGY